MPVSLLTATGRPLTAEDLYEFAWVSDPQLSPDGARVAYVLTRPERQGKKYTSAIWVAATVAGATARAFTCGERDRAPRWSPDGKHLAFISDRQGDGAQLWVMRTNGGEAWQLTRLQGGVASEPVWSPDGRQIAVLHRLLADAPPARLGAQTAAGAAGGAAAGAAPKSDVKVFTRLRYKENGKGLWDGKYAQVLVVELGGGDLRQVSHGPYDHGVPAWSPDGGFLAVCANRSADPDRTPTADVWVVPATGGEMRKVTVSAGPAASPTWSPDGRLIAYFGHDNRFRGATETHIYVVPADGSAAPVDILAGWDGGTGISAGSDMMTSSTPGPAWTPDGRAVLFQATERGAVNLYRALVPVAGRDPAAGGPPAAPQRVTSGQHAIYAVSFGPRCESAAAAIATPASPGDIHFYPSLGAAAPVRLITANAWLAERSVVAPEEFECRGPDGGHIHGWLMRPVGYAAGRRYPLIVEVHGGPHTAYGWAFMHEFQMLAGRGFGVMYCNPAGSTSYGQEFVTLTRHDWGGRDYRDLMAATDYAAGAPWVDGARLGITGGSYGGFMVNWVIGQTGRFRAAVTQRSTCNRYSMFGTSDIGYYHGDFEFLGNPWDEADFYLQRSPITYVAQVETPLLLEHSEQDLRCPMEQAEQFYTALRWLGKTAELVRFPDENHELSRSGQPVHRVERLTRIAGWFSKYLA